MRYIGPAKNNSSLFRATWSDGSVEINTGPAHYGRLVNGVWEYTTAVSIGPCVWEVCIRPAGVGHRNHIVCEVYDENTGKFLQFIEISATNFVKLMMVLFDKKIKLLENPRIGDYLKVKLTNSQHNYWQPLF